MTRIYGKDFSEFYNEKWAPHGEKIWGFISKIIKREKLHIKNWLDLCCGSGSLLKFVSAAKIDCYGLDISAHQLKNAKTNAPSAKLFCKDIREFSFSKKFDIITCIYDSINYLTSEKDILKVFRNVKKHLNKNGYFIFDINIVEGWEKAWGHNVIFRDEDKFLSVENIFNEIKEIGIFYVSGFKKKDKYYKRFEEVHIERCYCEKKVDNLLHSAGFKFHKYDGNKLKKTKTRSGRLLYICQK